MYFEQRAAAAFQTEEVWMHSLCPSLTPQPQLLQYRRSGKHIPSFQIVWSICTYKYITRWMPISPLGLQALRRAEITPLFFYLYLFPQLLTVCVPYNKYILTGWVCAWWIRGNSPVMANSWTFALHYLTRQNASLWNNSCCLKQLFIFVIYLHLEFQE